MPSWMAADRPRCVRDIVVRRRIRMGNQIACTPSAGGCTGCERAVSGAVVAGPSDVRVLGGTETHRLGEDRREDWPGYRRHCHHRGPRSVWRRRHAQMSSGFLGEVRMTSHRRHPRGMWSLWGRPIWRCVGRARKISHARRVTVSICSHGARQAICPRRHWRHDAQQEEGDT